MFLIIYSVTFIILGCAVLFFLYKRKQNDLEEDKNTFKSETANDFLNIKNIINSQLFNKDDYICSYIKIDPVNISLMEEKDMRLMTESLVAEFSSVHHDFKFIAVSKPEDNSELISQYSRKRQNTKNTIRRTLFVEEIRASQSRVQNREVPTREFYFMLWLKNETESEYIKRVIDFKTIFVNCNIGAKVASQKDIIKLVEQTTSPQYVVDEELNPELNFTFISKISDGGSEYAIF